MNRHAFGVLELARALDRVAGFAASPLGADAVRSLEPSDSVALAATELERVEQVMRLCTSHPDWAVPVVPDLRPALRRLRIAGSVLDAATLRRFAVLTAAARAVRRGPAASAEAFGLLAELVGRVGEFDAEEKSIGAAIDEADDVRDGASKELSRLRRELRGARSRIVAKLEEFMAALPERFRVTDASVTLRDGRYVIPVRREGRAEVGGIVHDESATGQTVFVEPPVAIELMNRLRELELAEAREVQRILAALTERLRPRADELAASLEALVELDSIVARARYALDCDGHPPEMVEADGASLRIVRGRHPLLLGGGRPVVPFDLELAAGERTLLVSGPNTGGKTVLLKAIGLICLLAQAGVVPPVAAGTRLPVFRDVFADIGDEQSIEASLSTFSAHLENLKEVLDRSDHESLVLIDEIGSGTDPMEGAALAASVLLELTSRSALTVATTHLGELKRLAAEASGIVNASLQFDAIELRPTYVLVKGLPGRSYGLAIAKRLGFPETVLARAESLLPEDERRSERLLAELEAQRRALTDALAEAEVASSEAVALRAELEERERAWRSRSRQMEREAREEARRILLDARQEVEQTIRALREEAAAGSPDFEKTAKEARRRIEGAARREGDLAAAAVATEAEAPAEAVSPGGHVRIAATGAVGVVTELREGRATVVSDGMRLSVPVSAVTPVAPPPERTPRPSVGWSAPEVEASPEVDLRGLRADEVASKLDPAIDDAVRAGLAALRIIHGKGTGVLREVVAERLAGDPRVRAFRPGAFGEGGTGVTIAELA